VPEPVADRHEVDARLEQLNGGRVSHHVGMNALRGYPFTPPVF
jgi:hypothetical protein